MLPRRQSLVAVAALIFGGGGSGGGATTSEIGSAGGGGGGGTAASGSGSGSPRAALVAGVSDSGSGDKNLRTEPRSPSSAPSAAPSKGADTRGAIGAWSPAGAPKLNGAPTAATSEAGADVGGTADGLISPNKEDGAERSGERSRASYDSGSTSCTSWTNLAF